MLSPTEVVILALTDSYDVAFHLYFQLFNGLFNLVYLRSIRNSIIPN